MNYKYFFLTSFLCIFSGLLLTSQTTDKENFSEALYLMDNKLFAEALPILEDLQATEEYKDNANVNFNLGVALYKSFDEEKKEKAIVYLQKAVEKTSPKYQPLSVKEEKAPIDVYYYLGLALHNDHQFDKAIENYIKFKSHINDKHYLYGKIDRLIQMSEFAKKAVADPVNIIVNNLGPKLNSFYPDFSPVIRIDESAIYFTSRRLRKDSSNYKVLDPADGNMFEDIYVSFNKDNEWQEPHLLNISTPGHEATLNLSIDGQTLYIYKDDEGNGELYESKLRGDSAGYGIWSKPEKLGSNINTKYFETHVTVTPNGRTLYFVSDRPGGYGGKDIYSSKMLPTGEWALAQNEGPTINTPFDEDGVFMHPDGETMYFSSNGHQSMGGYDIMYSTLKDTGWTQVQNMGYPINSVDDDVFFVTTPDGKRAYFSSFKEDTYGEKDIYMLQLIDAEEKALTLYRGEFTYVDSTTPPKGALVTIMDDLTGEIVGSYTPRARDGQFSAILAPNKTYHFIYEADEFRTYEEDIYVPKGSEYQEIYKEIKLRPVRVANDIQKMVKAEVKYATISGILKARGTPLPNTRVKLLTEDGRLLASTVTGDDGSFEFTALDPTKVYIVEVEGDNPPMYGYDLQLENDGQEEISYENVDNKQYLFTPSLSPYENYGISTPILAKSSAPIDNETSTEEKNSIRGKLTSESGKLKSTKIYLRDEGGEVIQQTTTDKSGNFVFNKIDYSSNYEIEVAEEVPTDTELQIFDDANNNLLFVKKGERSFSYYPFSSTSPLAKRSAVRLNGKISSPTAIISNSQISLLDVNKSKSSINKTDSTGEFSFENVDLSSQHYLQVEEGLPNNKSIELHTEEFGKINLKQVKSNLYALTPLFNAKLVSNNSQIISEIITKDEQNIVVDKIDKSKFYRLVFKNRSPQDNKLTVQSKDGEQIILNYLSRGVYEYNPNTNYDYAPRPLDVDGKLVVNGKVISNKKIDLISKDSDLLLTVITGKDGSFSFEKLNPVATYTVSVHEDNPPIQGYDFNLLNERGEKLIIDKIDNKTYRFTPSLEPEKYIKTKVFLKNENEEIIEKTTTDSSGAFQLTGLDIGKEYHLTFEDGFPEDKYLSITNGKGQKMKFEKVGDNTYKYTPTEETLKQLAEVNKEALHGTFTDGGAPLVNAAVNLKDHKGSVIQQTTTDNNGNFTFEKIDPSKIHKIELANPPSGSESEVNLKLFDEKDNQLLYVKENNSSFAYYPKTKSSTIAEGSSRDITGTVNADSSDIGGLQVNLLNVNRNKVFIGKTDSNGNLNFTDVDLSDEHFLQFDNLPEDATLNLGNSELGDIEFEEIEHGLYKIKPIYNIKLINSDHQIIAEKVTDRPENFKVDELDKNESYQLIFKNTAPTETSINILDKKGNQLTFESAGNEVYNYTSMDKMIAKNNPSLKGTLNRNGQAVQSGDVILKDINGNVIAKKEVDNGQFTFNNIDRSKNHQLIVDSEYENSELQLFDENNNKYYYIKEGEKTYRFYSIHEKSPIVVGNSRDVNGTITSATGNIDSLKVNLLDANRKTITSTTTDKNGQLKLNSLDLSDEHYLQFANLPKDATVKLSNKDLGDLELQKVGDGLYKIQPIYDVKLVDKNNQILSEVVTNDKKNLINVDQLDKDKKYQLVFKDEAPKVQTIELIDKNGERITVQSVGSGIYEYTPDYDFEFEPYTVNVKGDYSATYPHPKVLSDVITYYQRYFRYNDKDIDPQNENFVKFIDDIVNIINKKGNINIAITSSASKVPTSTFKNNSALSKKRAMATKSLLAKALSNKGIPDSKYNFVDINTLITGPEYKRDHIKNKSTFEQHQYVRVFIK